MDVGILHPTFLIENVVLTNNHNFCRLWNKKIYRQLYEEEIIKFSKVDDSILWTNSRLRIFSFVTITFFNVYKLHHHVTNFDNFSVIIASDHTLDFNLEKLINFSNLPCDVKTHIFSFLDSTSNSYLFPFPRTKSIHHEFANLNYFSFLIYLRLRAFDPILHSFKQIKDLNINDPVRIGFTNMLATFWRIAMQGSFDRKGFFFLPDTDELGFDMSTKIDLSGKKRACTKQNFHKLLV